MSVAIELVGPLEPPLSGLAEWSRAAAAAGVPGLWWPDHLMGWFPSAAMSPAFGAAPGQLSPDALVDPFIAAAVAAMVAPEVRRVGLVVTDPVRRHPASLLQSAATIASDGTSFVLGIGAGAFANIEPYGLETRGRFRCLSDGVETIRRLQQVDGPIWYEGPVFRLAGGVAALPARRDVQVWIGGSGEAFVTLAGRIGNGWIPTRLPPDEYERQSGVMRDEAAKARRPAPTASMYCWSIVAADHDEAHRLMAAPFLRSLLLFRGPSYFQSRGLAHPLEGIASSTRHIPATLTTEQLFRILDRIPFDLIHDYIVHGSPAEVVAWANEMGGHGLEHVVLNDVTRHVDGGEEACRLLDLWTEGRKGGLSGTRADRRHAGHQPGRSGGTR